MCAPIMVETSIVDIKPSACQLLASVLTTFPKHMVKTLLGLPRGKTTSDRLTMLTMRLDHIRNSQKSDMDDVTSVTAETGNVPIPSQIHRPGLKTCGTVEKALLQPADSKRCKL